MLGELLFKNQHYCAMKKIKIIVVTLLGFSNIAISQNSYSGTVFEENSTTPIPYAIVKVQNKNIGVVSNETNKDQFFIYAKMVSKNGLLRRDKALGEWKKSKGGMSIYLSGFSTYKNNYGANKYTTLQLMIY